MKYANALWVLIGLMLAFCEPVAAIRHGHSTIEEYQP